MNQIDSITFINLTPSMAGYSCPGTPTVTDHQGNVYNTVQIGSQCWTKENMRCTTSPTGKNWTQLTIDQASIAAPYYAIPSNLVCGVLYNWNAVIDSDFTVDTDCSFSGHRRGICPQGWHVPTHLEWSNLICYLGGDAIAGDKMKALSSLWTSPNANATNSSGFSAISTGFYHDGFSSGNDTYFWGINQSGLSYAWVRYLVSNYSDCFGDTYNKRLGFSVRCLKD
ncbi:MAG: fibrobacter succinogenes major paralogous domain-containing protein [Bacteroidales bacterium]